jgi:hypothetical protein
LSTALYRRSLLFIDSVDLPGSPRENIKFDFKNVECEDIGWIYLAQDWGNTVP